VPGWASTLSEIGQRQIAVNIRTISRQLGAVPIVILTSPAYKVLARILYGRYPLVYYCADDYREYKGWGGLRAADAEADIVGRCVFSVFVSEALRRRAIVEYGVGDHTTFTSPNATEPRFLYKEHLNLGGAPPNKFAGCRLPIVGVLGGLSARLDLDLVHAVADLDEVGTLAVVGPIGPDTPSKVHKHQKVVVTGAMPHSEMHFYARALDAALIPYAVQNINYFCSPMRLYDHLATGVPIFSTNACDQINSYGEPLLVDERDALPSKIALSMNAGLYARLNPPKSQPILWSSRAEKLLQVFDVL
jgi:teichuronic acid biosynthesis glycosyltransferase TuaH